MRRREFLGVISGVVAAWPLAAQSQQPSMPVVGLLAAPAAASYGYIIDAVRRGLKEAGYIEGQNVAIEYRWAHEGVNQYALARNMGTSVQMLETFYGHTTNRTMATELTKNKGRQKKALLWE